MSKSLSRFVTYSLLADFFVLLCLLVCLRLCVQLPACILANAGSLSLHQCVHAAAWLLCDVQWYCWPEGFIGQSFSLADELDQRASPLLEDVDKLYEFVTRRREMCRWSSWCRGT